MLIVGKSCFATLGSANSFGIRVGALISNWQVGVLLGAHRGWILRIASFIKK